MANQGGGFDVFASHTYAAPGTYTIAVGVVKPGDGSGAGQGKPSTAVLTKAVIKPNWNDTSRYQLKLDVNHNGRIDGDLLPGGVADGIANYLPGYSGNQPMLSKGPTFVKTQFTPQLLWLTLDGVGTNVLHAAGVSQVTFEINWDSGHVFHHVDGYQVTYLPGYAGNATSSKVTGATKDADFSFSPDVNQGSANAADVKTGARKSWAPFYAKDYGGKVIVRAKLLDSSGKTLHTFLLGLPQDANHNGIADSWEVAKVQEWNQYYGTHYTGDPLQFFQTNQDDEYPTPKDPKGGRGSSPATLLPNWYREGGDGLPLFYEYRGVVVDGGGYSPDGKTSAQGYIRLSPAKREVLIDVDRMNTAATEAQVRTWMNLVTKAYSQQQFGTGVFAYYVLHNTPNNPTLFKKSYINLQGMMEDMRRYIDPMRGITTRFTGDKFKDGNPDFEETKTANWTFHEHWRHLMIGLTASTLDKTLSNLDQMLTYVSGFSSNTTALLEDKAGSFLFANDTAQMYKNLKKFLRDNGVGAVPVLDNFVAGIITHELAHQLAQDNGHYVDADGDGNKNTANDFRTVQFAYDQTPIPAGYYYQDYWVQPIRYGHGSQGKSFLTEMDLSNGDLDEGRLRTPIAP